MDDEMFITHLLNSLPQLEYERSILVIKDKLGKEEVDLPEIEQILEDKYQSMKHVKGWDKEEDDYALFTSHSNKKKHKKPLREDVLTVVSMDIKQLIVPVRTAIRLRVPRGNLIRKRNTVLKESTSETDTKICPKLNATIVENMGIIHVQILLKKMMDLDNSSVNEEFTMMCINIHCEDGDKDKIMYGDQGVSTEEHDKATYGKLMKTQSEEEETVNYNVALCTNTSMSLEKKKKVT